jgi:uncharacterized protein
MNCPKCEVQLENKPLAGIDIDECAKCSGMWFEKDELRQAKDKTDSDLNWMDFEIWKNVDNFLLTSKQKPCPACKSNMVATEYADTKVTIDCCPKCDGIWLDKGEFEKIIFALEDELKTKSAKDYVKASIAEAKEIITGGENIISEWKDFTTVLRMMQYRMLVENQKLQNLLQKAQENNPAI